MSARGAQIAPRTNLAPSPLASGAASSPESSSPGGITTIATSREWVLPPRPKPGRKPSVDTPASKRKAQNRAAQRAFRERRATRVQELEQKLLEVEKDKETREMGLVNTINKLKFENQFLIKSLEQLRLEFQSFRAAGSSPSRPDSLPASGSASLQANAYKSELSQSAHQLLEFAKSLPAQVSASPALLQYSVQQILPAPSADSPPSLSAFRSVAPKSGNSTQITPISHKLSPDKKKDSTDDFDCGICLKERCLCEDVGLKSKSLEDTFKSFTPMAAVSLRAKRKVSEVKEIDFTAGYKKMPDLKKLRKNSLERDKPRKTSLVSMGGDNFDESSPVENCGFCTDDTPCVCREAAKEAARLNQSLQEKEEEEHDAAGPMLLPPIQVKDGVSKAPLPVMHPGPSLEIREYTNLTPGAVPTVVTKEETAPETSNNKPDEEKSGCTGNPGTCMQCQMDPMSTLFCTTVASKAALEPTQATQDVPKALPTGDEKSSASLESSSLRTSSLGPSSLGPSSLGSISAASSTSSVPLPSGGIFIPCSDAYKTLSRHKRFNSVDFLSLVGRLTTRGMLVEAQSVANVIRELDRKVYD